MKWKVIQKKMNIELVDRKQICTIKSKINGTPKSVYLPISKLHSILAVANLLANLFTWLK